MKKKRGDERTKTKRRKKKGRREARK